MRRTRILSSGAGAPPLPSLPHLPSLPDPLYLP
jgi:hypothetical protein